MFDDDEKSQDFSSFLATEQFRPLRCTGWPLRTSSQLDSIPREVGRRISRMGRAFLSLLGLLVSHVKTGKGEWNLAYVVQFWIGLIERGFDKAR